MAEERRHTLIKTASYEADPEEVGRVLLLYSGGLDTSVMLKWIQDEYEAEVVGSSVPVLLDVYGSHCPPCHQLAPTIDRLASHYEGRAKVLKVEAGANGELAGQLAVTAVPTVVAFRDGKEVGRLVGYRPESAYRKLLEEAGVEA